ncbi:MAG TPA: SH3 domain-containing protein [Desulfobacterales bacterium]|nr:SH3 domain-containing protein [Desulfobacterales bacterium]
MAKPMIWMLLGVLLLGFGGSAAAERMAVSVKEANVRSAPQPNADVLWKVEKFHPVDVLEASGVWLRFKDYEGDGGWIHKTMVDKTAAVITRQNGCQLRAGPGMDQPVLIKIDKGVPFKVLKREGRWILVEHADGDKGWLNETLVW